MNKWKKTLSISLFVIGILIAKSAELLAADKYKVVDGDSLEYKSTRIRLIDIDAPELFQKCYDEYDKKYECGKVASNELKKLMSNKVVCK